MLVVTKKFKSGILYGLPSSHFPMFTLNKYGKMSKIFDQKVTDNNRPG